MKESAMDIARHISTPRRLRPITQGTGWRFGFLLKQRGVPVEPRTNEGKLAHEDAGETGALYAVPLCCAELYFSRLEKTSALHGLAVETIAQLAADVYFEEVKGAEMRVRKAFALREGEDSTAISRLEGAGHKGRPGRNLSTIYMLTRAEAEEVGLPWN